MDRRRAVVHAYRARGADGLGVVIDTATSDEDAYRRMKAEQYDVIISDIARGDRNDAGLAFIPTIREHDISVPIIFYIRNLAPNLGTPASAHGLTNRPDELVDFSSTHSSVAESEANAKTSPATLGWQRLRILSHRIH